MTVPSEVIVLDHKTSVIPDTKVEENTQNELNENVANSFNDNFISLEKKIFLKLLVFTLIYKQYLQANYFNDFSLTSTD